MKEELIDSYYAIAHHFKNSKNSVEGFQHYKTAQEAIKEAKTLSNNDTLHIYEVRFIEKIEVSFNDDGFNTFFEGVKINNNVIASFFNGISFAGQI